MLVLLIVFMISAPLLTSGVAVDLPQADELAAARPGRAAQRHDRRRRQGLPAGHARSTIDQLGPRLQAITGRKADARIFVRGDKGIDYGTVMAVVSTINRAGFNKVALLTEVPVASGPDGDVAPAMTGSALRPSAHTSTGQAGVGRSLTRLHPRSIWPWRGCSSACRR